MVSHTVIDAVVSHLGRAGRRRSRHSVLGSDRQRLGYPINLIAFFPRPRLQTVGGRRRKPEIVFDAWTPGDLNISSRCFHCLCCTTIRRRWCFLSCYGDGTGGNGALLQRNCWRCTVYGIQCNAFLRRYRFLANSSLNPALQVEEMVIDLVPSPLWSTVTV